MTEWEKKQKAALELSVKDSRFNRVAEEWTKKIENASALRKKIIEQRAESLSLLNAIQADREIVLAYYDLGQADVAIQALQDVSDQLATMNESMWQIVDQTKSVAGVPQ